MIGIDTGCEIDRMTAHAIQRRACVTARVAIVARDRQVRTGQRKARTAVVDFVGVPVVRRMTIRTILIVPVQYMIGIIGV